MDDKEPLGSAPDETVSSACEETEGDTKESRMDQAKAWMRAMMAGGGDLPLPSQSLTSDAGDDAQNAAGESSSCRNCQQLAGELVKVTQKASEAEALYKRMAADFENYRRRIDREREEQIGLGIQKVVELLLPALDDLDRAQSNLSAEVPAEKLIDGLKLVYNRILKSMEQVGVKSLAAVGEHFDPKFHEGVQEIETTEFPDGSVVQELRRGYTLNDRVIRPALVNVASNSQLPPVGHGQAESTGELSGGKVYDLNGYEDSDQDAVGERVDEAAAPNGE